MRLASLSVPTHPTIASFASARWRIGNSRRIETRASVGSFDVPNAIYGVFFAGWCKPIRRRLDWLIFANVTLATICLHLIVLNEKPAACTLERSGNTTDIGRANDG